MKGIRNAERGRWAALAALFAFLLLPALGQHNAAPRSAPAQHSAPQTHSAPRPQPFRAQPNRQSQAYRPQMQSR